MQLCMQQCLVIIIYHNQKDVYLLMQYQSSSKLPATFSGNKSFYKTICPPKTTHIACTTQNALKPPFYLFIYYFLTKYSNFSLSFHQLPAGQLGHSYYMEAFDLIKIPNFKNFLLMIITLVKWLSLDLESVIHSFNFTIIFINELP